MAVINGPSVRLWEWVVMVCMHQLVSNSILLYLDTIKSVTQILNFYTMCCNIKHNTGHSC